MVKKIILFFSLVLVFLLGGYLTHRFYQAQLPKVETNAEVLLERIETVTKLITVEGHFSEIYNYKEYQSYDISWFRKKALLRVKAKVSIGYDMEQLKIETRPEEKLLIISNIPDPMILSIDHDLDYFDLQEGFFNTFSEADYNTINQNAKDMIRETAEKSDLYPKAVEQGNKILEMIKIMANASGWEVKTKDVYGVLRD